LRLTTLHTRKAPKSPTRDHEFPRSISINPPPGEHLPYWGQIPYTRFLFDFWWQSFNPVPGPRYAGNLSR
jgi:hypothetical protein